MQFLPLRFAVLPGQHRAGCVTLSHWSEPPGGEILYTPGGHGGYFLPSLDAEQAQRERLAFYRVMKARAVCTFKTLRPVARSLGIPAGQLAFDLTENEQPEKES